MDGFIKLHRKILNWEWYTDVNTFALFIECLFEANYVDKKWKGIEVKRGSFITSYSKLAKNTGLSVQQVRTSLNKLISTQCITKSSQSKYTMITVLNYDKYQSINTIDNNQITNNQQTNNKQITTTKERKERKNIKKDKNRERQERDGAPESMGITAPTLKEVQAFVQKKKLKFKPESFYYYYESNGWMVKDKPMRNWKAMAMRWNSTENEVQTAAHKTMQNKDYPKWYAEQEHKPTKPNDVDESKINAQIERIQSELKKGLN